MSVAQISLLLSSISIVASVIAIVFFIKAYLNWKKVLKEMRGE